MSAQQRTKCAYYGRLQSAGRVVRDVCPHRSGSFYFTIDIDPGRSGGTTRLREAAIISPQNAVTNASAADDGPGYDLYIATDCIPVPEAPGIRQAHSADPHVAHRLGSCRTRAGQRSSGSISPPPPFSVSMSLCAKNPPCLPAARALLSYCQATLSAVGRVQSLTTPRT